MSDDAIEAAAAAIPAGAAPVAITGESALAQALRARLGGESSVAAEARPGVVVETTGQADAIRAALEHVADLGTVVLAGPLGPGPIALDLYADLHLRGLTVVAVPPQPAGEAEAT